MDDNQKQFHMWAFAGFVEWAASNGESIKAFEAEHGEYKAPKSMIDKMIDTATGRDRKVFDNFVNFCATQYGTEFLPDDYLNRLTNQHKEGSDA